MRPVLQITLDCADPPRLVRFWTLALGYVPEPPPENFASWTLYWRSIGIPDEELGADDDEIGSIIDPDGVGPRIWFQPVPESKVVKNRLHLDLKISGGRPVPLELRRERVDAEVERLVAAGASVLWVTAVEGANHYAVTMADPEGNEFCVA